MNPNKARIFVSSADSAMHPQQALELRACGWNRQDFTEAVCKLAEEISRHQKAGHRKNLDEALDEFGRVTALFKKRFPGIDIDGVIRAESQRLEAPASIPSPKPFSIPAAIHPEQAARTAVLFAVAPFFARKVVSSAQKEAMKEYFETDRFDGVAGAAPFGYGIALYAEPAFAAGIAHSLNAAVSEVICPGSIVPALGPAFLVPKTVARALEASTVQTARVGSLCDRIQWQDEAFDTIVPSSDEFDYSAFEYELVYEPTGEIVGYMNAAAAAFTPDHLNAALAERCI